MHSFSVSVVKFGKRVKDWLLREGTVQWKRMCLHLFAHLDAYMCSVKCLHVLPFHPVYEHLNVWHMRVRMWFLSDGCV